MPEPQKGLGAHARIRTGDLFLTKWSSVPGEFDPILALPIDFGRHHLTRRYVAEGREVDFVAAGICDNAAHGL
jgi:hypothetical protein